MICFFIDKSSDIANYADDAAPYECVPYYNKSKELTNKEYLFGSSKIISKLMLLNVIFSYRPIGLLP